jgi:hypothetical protein
MSSSRETVLKSKETSHTKVADGEGSLTHELDAHTADERKLYNIDKCKAGTVPHIHVGAKACVVLGWIKEVSLTHLVAGSHDEPYMQNTDSI